MTHELLPVLLGDLWTLWLHPWYLAGLLAAAIAFLGALGWLDRDGQHEGRKDG